MKLKVKVFPGAGIQRLDWPEDGILRVRLTSRPIEGRANQELLRLLSKRLKVPKSAVSIIAGSRGREKLINIDRVIDQRDLISRLGG